MSNLPVGVKNELDDQDMICTECEHREDVDNGVYVNHRWYCNDCYKELFKKCPKCEVIISVDCEFCLDCLEEKIYEESAEGMFDEMEFKKSVNEREIRYTFTNDENAEDEIIFNLKAKCYEFRTDYEINSFLITTKVHNAITQQMKELKWL